MRRFGDMCVRGFAAAVVAAIVVLPYVLAVAILYGLALWYGSVG